MSMAWCHTISIIVESGLNVVMAITLLEIWSVAGCQMVSLGHDGTLHVWCSCWDFVLCIKCCVYGVIATTACCYTMTLTGLLMMIVMTALC